MCVVKTKILKKNLNIIIIRKEKNEEKYEMKGPRWNWIHIFDMVNFVALIKKCMMKARKKAKLLA